MQQTKQLLEDSKTPWNYQTHFLITTINLIFVVRNIIYIHLCLFFFVVFFLNLVFLFFLFLNGRARRQIIYPLDQLRGNAPSERILKEKVKRDNLVPQILRFVLCFDAVGT